MSYTSVRDSIPVAAAFELQETVLMRASQAFIESNERIPPHGITPADVDLRSIFLLLKTFVIAGVVSTAGTRRRFRRKLWLSPSPDGLSS